MTIAELWSKGYLLWLLSPENPATPEGGYSGPIFFSILFGGVLIVSMLIPYLLGSINSAVALSRLVYHDDIRRHGSGNAGTTNMLRTYGKKAAVLTLLGDVLKSVVAVVTASFLMSVQLGGWLAGLFCMLGHVFPIYYHFRGGKGVLCAAAALLVLSPAVFALLLLVFIIMVAWSKYVSLGSIVGAGMLPLIVNMVNVMKETGGINGAVSVAMAILVILCHRENIKRIQNRTESKLSFKKKPSASEDDAK